MTEVQHSPDEGREPERATSPLLKLSDAVRNAVQNAITESPAGQRLLRLKERLEAGEIREIFDGSWVVMCYTEQQEMGIDDPCITKADTRGGAIVLTLDDMKDICALKYLSDTGEEIVIDDQMMEDGETEILVVFPEELGESV